MPTGVTAGDILIAHAYITYDGKSGVHGDETYTGWTRRGYAFDFSTAYYAAVYTKTAGASESSFTWTGGANWWGAQMSIVAVSGATAIDAPGDMYSGLTGLSLNATTTNGLLLGFWTSEAFTGLGTLTSPATMTQRVNSQFRSSSTLRYLNTLLATQTLTASGATGDRTATVVSGSQIKFAHLILVK